MADRPSVGLSKSEQMVMSSQLNAVDVFEETVKSEINNAKTGLSSSDSSLPGLVSRSYGELWKERPLAAAATTAGVTAVGGAALWKMPKTSSHIVGAYGASKFLLTDAPDLASSNGFADVAKYGLACTSDLAMVAGTAARYIPKVRSYSTALTAGGVIGRLGSELLPQSEPSTFFSPDQFKQLSPKNQPEPSSTLGTRDRSPVSAKAMVDVSLKSGEVDKRSYEVFVPNTADKALPVVLLLPGVENDGAPGIESESRLNELAEKNGFIAVYPRAKERDQPMIGKVRDWNSPGAGLTVENSNYDDVDYIKSVLAGVKQTAKVDENAIYAVGFSSGGQFVQHLRGRMPGTFAGIGSIHGTVLGTEAKPDQFRPQDRAAFISVHSDGDHMLPYNGGKGLMTIPLDRVSTSKPHLQLQEAAIANGMAGAVPKVTAVDNIRVTAYGDNSLPVREYYIQGGWRGGLVGGLLGRGRDGFPASHAVDGTGAGGWPVVGDKNRSIDATKLVVDQLLKYRRNDSSK